MDLNRLLAQEQGSFSLESALVFPLLLAMILLYMLFGMYMYQKVVLYFSASSLAERTAFAWDNSSRDPRTGMLGAASYDGLYWRMGENGMLDSVFGLQEEEMTATVFLPAAAGQQENSGQELAEYKLLKASERMLSGVAGLSGQAGYQNKLMIRSVEVKLKRPLSSNWGGKSREPKTAARAAVVEPVEFIRSVDLARYYVSRFSSGGAAASNKSKAQAGEVLAPYKGGRGYNA